MKARGWTLMYAVTLLAAAGAAAQDTAMATKTVAMDSERVREKDSLLDRPAQLTLEATTLAPALIRLSEASGVPVAFSSTVVGADSRRISCHCQNLTIREALDHLLRRTSLGYREFKGEILVFLDVREAARQATRYAMLSLDLKPSFPRAVRPVFQGTIIGQVMDAATASPLESVEVYIPGQNRGVLTQPNGRFILTNVPEGTHTVRAERIGYAAAEETVTVSAGQSVTVTFELRRQALRLDEIVVTGTAGGTERRAVGNAIDRLDLETQLELASPPDVQQVLAFRSPGVSSYPSTSGVGNGGSIRIRGSSSLSLSNDPIVYIDGVRANSAVRGTRSAINRINDINPEDIQSIEIIKGPAAATLYGTEASAGVIQIITKKGTTGAPEFDVSIRQGTQWFPDPAGAFGPKYGRDDAGNIVSVNVYEREAEQGLGPPFQYGHLQSYSVQARGGTDVFRYFASASRDDDQGITEYNTYEASSVRANLQLVPRENLSLSLNTSLVKSEQGDIQPFPDDLFKQIVWGGPDRCDTRTRCFLRRTPEAIRDETQTLHNVTRTISSFTVTHNPAAWLDHRFDVGIDITREDDTDLVRRSPEGAAGMFQANSLGRRRAFRTDTDMLTVEYGATLSLPVTENIASETSAGVQFYSRNEVGFSMDGEIFPAPGFESLSSMARTSSSESFFENKTLGTYVQEQLGWRNRLFVTGAVRFDDNSAFGADFDGAIYPKASLTWVLHEEPFWNVPLVSQFRFRTAWGAAGRQPNIFDARRLYAAVTGPGDGAGVHPSSFGNVELKPERSSEIEVGFDAAFAEDRVALSYTYYNRTTEDALVPAPIVPSMGFPGDQMLNAGLVKNWGHEFQLSGQAWQGAGKSWEVGGQLGLMQNRIVDLGPRQEIFASDGRGAGWHREGFPLEGIFFRRVLEADLLDDGTPINMMCDGGTGPNNWQAGGDLVPCEDAPDVYWGRAGNPTWEAGLWSTLTFGDLRLFAQVDGRGGHMFMDVDIPVAHTSFSNTSVAVRGDDPIVQAYRGDIGRQALGFANAGFVKFRELSATYTLPAAWVESRGGSRASITVSGRNLGNVWQEQTFVTLPDGREIPDPKIMDPERRWAGDQGNFVEAQIPPLTSVEVTLRFSF